MKEFIYLLHQEGSLFIVESDEGIPGHGMIETKENFNLRLYIWVDKSTKYHIADKNSEHKFCDLVGIYNGENNTDRLTAGIRIKSENVEIKPIHPADEFLSSVEMKAFYRPSPPLVIGGEETQEELWREVTNTEPLLSILKSKFHITRINQ